MTNKHLLYTLLAILFCLTACGAQSDQGVATNNRHYLDSVLLSSYDFIDIAADTIIDPTGSMAPFYDALDSIQSSMATVPIIHFGDSHIQGGMLTEAVMRRFAAQYGTAGRGFITPHRMTGKNEPRDYSITASPASGGGITIIDAESRSADIGISGVAAACPAKTSLTLRVLTLPEDPTDYRFTRIVAFHDSLAPIITTSDPNLLDDAGGSDIFNSFSTEINLLNPTESISLLTYADGAYTNGAIYGFSLENGKPGVIYHSIGVNGACFLHWGRNKSVATQSAALLPRLIIISLGSNEASGNNFNTKVFTDQMDSFIAPLMVNNPGVPILLVTPAEAMRGRGSSQKPNTNFVQVQAAMKNYALQKGIALFDMFAATSAAGSATKWKAASLLGRDGVHYTVDGYTVQGVLIFNAIANTAQRHHR